MNAFDHKAWTAAGFKDFSEYGDGIEYVNQSEYGDGQLEGEWWYADDKALVIYSGSFGNDNSPGAESYTYAEQYDTREEFDAAVKEWESKPEYLETDEDEETDEED